MKHSIEPLFRNIDTSTPVLILNLYHHLGLGIVRSLGRLGIEVHGVNEFRSTPAYSSRYFRGQKLAFSLEDDPEASVHFLREIAHRIGRRTLLIPTTDDLAQFIADYRPALEDVFIYPALDSDLVRTLCSKKEMYFLAKRMSVPTAETLFPQCREDVLDFMSRTTFPLLLKGIYGRRLVQRASKKMIIVRSKKELLEAYDRMEDPQEPNLMLQELIPGPDTVVWFFNGYFNADSEPLMGLTGKKIRLTPAYTGYTSLGICLPNPMLHDLTVRFMKDIQYRGILDIEYKYDARDGLYKVLDINPRIGAAFRLFTGKNGLDVARAWYLDMTGQPVPATTLSEGRKFMVEERDLMSSVRYYRDGNLTIQQWFRSWKGIREYAWFAADDIRPFFAMLLRLVTSKVRRARSHGTERMIKTLPRPQHKTLHADEVTASTAE